MQRTGHCRHGFNRHEVVEYQDRGTTHFHIMLHNENIIYDQLHNQVHVNGTVVSLCTNFSFTLKYILKYMIKKE
jgi:hypothetical protein